MNNLASAMVGTEGERVALSDVAVSAVLRDLLAEVTVAQTYRNDETVNIEAVYTFPLPLDAVLLELKVEMDGRVLEGVVVEKKAAEEGYEDAVASGDAAVMVQMLEPGLYSMNVGNLLPREKATITFTYAMLYRWTGDSLRFSLPTTVAPRFGESPHAPHLAPEASLTVENEFSLRLEITGSLREAQFVCPTHQVALERSANKVLITLQEPKAVMDRDFVMTVKAPQSAHTFALSGRDGDGLAAMASFQPFFPGLRKPRALNLAIVIDCSGSMAGDSINQAKQALDGILDGLQPHDHLTIIAFGNATNALSARLLVADKKNLKKSREFARGLEADMGGTEIGSALEVAYAAFGRSEPGDVFLVTDGEVSSWDSVVNDAKVSGHRVFTVGVGSAVSEAFVRELAEGTGGQCELVSPSENMADRIVRHFERVRAARATRVAVHWPEGARDVAPSPLRSVFEGDTVVTCARFDDPATHGAVVLEIETEEGKVGRQELQLVMAPSVESTDGLSTVARLAASIRLKGLDDAAGLETALRYRLVSPWTHWLVVAARPESERAQDAPALRKVPQSLAAGWGGTGRVAPSITQACIDRPLPPLTGSPSFSRRKATASRRAPRILKQIPFDRGEFVRSLPEATPTRVQPSAPPGFPRLLELIEVSPSRLDPRRAIELLREAGLSHELEEIFERARQSGINVEAIAALALSDLLSGVLAEELSPEALSALKHLKRWAHDMSDVMGKLARHSHDLLRLTALRGDPAGLFEPRRRHDLEAALEQVTSLADLRTAVQVFAETSNLRVLSDRATQPGRRRS